MKNLYQKPVISLFRSEMVENRITNFSSSIKELGYYDSFMKKPSSVNCYYKNRILTRQRFSIVNQGAETTARAHAAAPAGRASMALPR